MNESIAFPQLVELLASKASTTSRMSELFLKEFFALAADAMAQGSKVKIKDLGVLTVEGSGDDKIVTFVPCKQLAEAVNAPFEQFKPVELCDEVTDEQLAEIDKQMQASDPSDESQPATPPQPEEPAAPPTEHEEPAPQPAEEQSPAPPQAAPAIAPPAATQPAPAAPEEHDTSTPPSRLTRKHMIVAAAIVAAAVIAGIALFGGKKKPAGDGKELIAAVHEAQSKVENVVVTDTLSGYNSLRAMAKKHYGDRAFWIYIYKENSTQYPDYRDIPSGSVLVVPDAGKYMINYDSKASLRRARTEASKLIKEMKLKDEALAAQTAATQPDSLDTTPSHHHHHHR